MSNMLRDGVEWLDEKRVEHLCDEVKYYHNSQMYTVNATFGSTQFEALTQENHTVGSRVWDFLINAEELVFEPKIGDFIIYGGSRYKVVQLGEDSNGWRWSDPYQTTYRIHTIQVAA